MVGIIAHWIGYISKTFIPELPATITGIRDMLYEDTFVDMDENLHIETFSFEDEGDRWKAYFKIEGVIPGGWCKDSDDYGTFWVPCSSDEDEEVVFEEFNKIGEPIEALIDESFMTHHEALLYTDEDDYFDE